MNNPTQTVAVVVIRDNNHVLLLGQGPESKHQSDLVGFPAGRLEEGESYEQAAIRELEEESGLVAIAKDLAEVPETFSASMPRSDGTTLHMEMKVFVLKTWGGKTRTTPEGIPFWQNIHDLDGINFLPNCREVLEKYVLQ